MTFKDYIFDCLQFHLLYPKQRQGQVAFNVLADARPDISEKVQGTEIDPFYDDEHLLAFYDFVAKSW